MKVYPYMKSVLVWRVVLVMLAVLSIICIAENRKAEARTKKAKTELKVFVLEVASRAPINRAKVEYFDIKNNIRYKRRTKGSGKCVFKRLSGGIAILTVYKEGFSTSTHEVTIKEGETVTVEVLLKAHGFEGEELDAQRMEQLRRQKRQKKKKTEQGKTS